MVVETAKAYAELKQILDFWLEPVDLESEKGRKLKADWDQEQKWKRVAAEQKKSLLRLDPPPAQRIRGFLDRIEQGDFDAWWQISYWAEIEDNGRYSRKDHHIDIRKLPGWEKAAGAGQKTDNLRRRRLSQESQIRFKCLVRKAKRSISANARGPASSSVYWRMKIDQRFDELPIDVWTKWVPAIVHQQHYDETNEFRLLLTTAIEKVPQTATDRNTEGC